MNVCRFTLPPAAARSQTFAQEGILSDGGSMGMQRRAVQAEGTANLKVWRLDQVRCVAKAERRLVWPSAVGTRDS